MERSHDRDQSPGYPRPGTDTTPAEIGPTPETEAATTPEVDTVNAKKELITLAEASDLAGVSVGALRKRYRSGNLERQYDDAGRVLLDAAEVRRVYRIAQATDQKEPAELHSVQPKKEPATEVPEGSVLVPLSAWEKMLEQLGNLHTAGQDIAEARETRAEERESFAQQRRQEAENRARSFEEELLQVKDSHDRYANVTDPEPTTGGTEPEPPGDTRREAIPGTRIGSIVRRIRFRR